MDEIRTLAVIDGDLVLSGGSFLTLDGAPKIKQDLTFALNDTYGADLNHPYWGSILDRFLGQPLTASLEQQVTAEVERVLNNYVSVQIDQVNRAIAADVKGQYSTADVVSSVQAINVSLNFDTIVVSLTLTTMSQDTVNVTRTVSL